MYTTARYLTTMVCECTSEVKRIAIYKAFMALFTHLTEEKLSATKGWRCTSSLTRMSLALGINTSFVFISSVALNAKCIKDALALLHFPGKGSNRTNHKTWSHEKTKQNREELLSFWMSGELLIFLATF